MGIFKRFPRWDQIAPVYAVIVLMIYTWTIMWFFWKLPSWLFFMNISEILITLMYSLAVNFIESLVILCAPVFLGVVLPRKWFYDSFVSRGTALALTGLGYMMYVVWQFQTKNDYPSNLLKTSPLVLAGVIILSIVFLAGKFSVSKRALEVIGEKATIFLYVSIPISVISLAVVIVHSVV